MAKTNDTETTTDIVPQDELDEIFTELTRQDPKSKQYKFYLYYLFGFPIKTCANKAGYAESTGYAMVQKYKKQPKLRHKVDQILNMFPEQYRAICKLRLPQIAEIEGKSLDEYEKKPRLAIDKPQLLKQLKQAGEVDLGEPTAPPKATINVKELRVFMKQFAPDHSKPIPIPDAEVSDTDTK